MTEINENIPTVVKKDMWDISVCATCSVTSPVVTRGDEESRPWNPLPRVCKEISPKRSPYTHTCSHTLCLHLDEPPCSPVFITPPAKGYEEVGADRAQSPLLSGSLGLHWNLHPWPWERTGPTLLHSPIVEEEEEEGSSRSPHTGGEGGEREHTQRRNVTDFSCLGGGFSDHAC